MNVHADTAQRHDVAGHKAGPLTPAAGQAHAEVVHDVALDRDPVGHAVRVGHHVNAVIAREAFGLKPFACSNI